MRVSVAVGDGRLRRRARCRGELEIPAGGFARILRQRQQREQQHDLDQRGAVAVAAADLQADVGQARRHAARRRALRKRRAQAGQSKCGNVLNGSNARRLGSTRTNCN